MRRAVVVNDIVVNIVMSGASDTSSIACPDETSIGWGCVAGAWVSPVLAIVDDPFMSHERVAARAAHKAVKDKAAKKLGLTVDEALVLFDGEAD